MKRRTAVGCLVGILLGGMVAALCAYFLLLNPIAVATARATYFSAIAQARLSALELQLARDGRTEELIVTLESGLDGHLLDAAIIEDASPTFRDRQADEQLAIVRQYRATHPSPQRNKGVQDEIMRILTQIPGHK